MHPIFAEFKKRKNFGIRYDYGAGNTAELVFGDLPKSLFATHHVSSGFTSTAAIWGVNAKGFRSRGITLSIKQAAIWSTMTFGTPFPADFNFDPGDLLDIAGIDYNLLCKNCKTYANRAYKNAKLVEGLPTK